MKKLAKKVNVLIILVVLSYIFIGTTSTVAATGIIKEKEQVVGNSTVDPNVTESSTNSNTQEEEEISTIEEETTMIKEDDSEKNDVQEATDDFSSEEEQNLLEDQVNEVPIESEIEGNIETTEELETSEKYISNEKSLKESTNEESTNEESTSEKSIPEDNLAEDVSKNINEEGYTYSLQQNRELAMQIMEEDLMEKNRPRLFSARSSVPSHVTSFIEKFVPLAVKYANQKGLYPSVMLAQAALESGWGRSLLSEPPYHQLFGIKAGNFTGSVIKVPTEEWVIDKSHPNGGYMETIMAEFRVYKSFEEAFKDQSNFLMKPRYTKVRKENAPTYQHATQALSDAGYATDTKYASKLNNIIKSYGLDSYDKIPTVSYSSHIQSKSWLPVVNNGVQSGTPGESKRMEAIKIEINDYEDLGINYSTHVQSKGWTDWVSNGEISGTTGYGKRMEAIKLQLTGKQADAFDVFYKVYVGGRGWLDWAKNGSPSGTTGYGQRIEAISIKILPKGYNDPSSNNLDPYYEKPESISYISHVQKDGWKSYVKDGKTSGTTGQKKRLEAIKVNLKNYIYNGSIQYKGHVEKDGWHDWVNEGQLSGTEGQAKRLEAIQIKLTGKITEVYDVYYRVHVQSYGWLGWAKNGASAGSEGLAKQLEAIEVKLIPKGNPAPGKTNNTFIK